MFALLTTENDKSAENSYAPPQIKSRMPVILIVEDDEDSRLMLKTLLEMWSYRVFEAADGIEAISIAEQTRPDLILMDAKLPNLDGFETTRRIRQSATINDVPIIFLSACAEAVYRGRASDAGANEYLVKPLIFEQLEISLEKYLCQPQKILPINFSSPVKTARRKISRRFKVAK